MIKNKRIKVNNLSIHFLFSKSRKPLTSTPIILVHGMAVSSKYMVPLMQQLSPFFTVYAPDLPGYGKSDKPKAVLSVEKLADFLAAWMQAEGIKKAILLGNSMGCQIIVDFALRHPKKISHAILAGPTIDPKTRSFFQQTLRLMWDTVYEPPSAVFTVIKDSFFLGPFRLQKIAKSALHDPIEKQLTRIKIPTLVVRGEKDPTVSQRWVEEMHRLLSNSKLVVIPEKGHVLNYNAPKELTDEILTFLNK